MEEEVLNSSVTLIDDEGKEMNFEVLDFIRYNNRDFYALLPNFELSDQSDSPDEEEKYFIFEAKNCISDDSKYFEEVKDDDILDKLSVIFEEHFKKIF